MAATRSSGHRGGGRPGSPCAQAALAMPRQPSIAPLRLDALPHGARSALVLVAVAIVAFNLRTPTASLPPLLADVQRGLGLSGPAMGSLTALPVLCMALCAPPAQRLAHRVGREATTLWGIGLVAAGTLLRLGGDAPVLLFGGTLVAGVGIAVCGVTLPSIIKDRFPDRPGVATAAYTVPMMLGAAVAPTLAVPLLHALGGWEASLASWAVPALLAAALWAPLARRSSRRRPATRTAAGRLPWRSRSAWLLAGFLSVQSVLAYAYLAWLAPAYESRGWSAATTGALLGVLHLAQLVTALALPALADLSRDRRPALVAAVTCTALGAGVLFAAPDAAPWAATIVLGLGLGGGFSLALVLLADFAASPAAAGRLAAMTFLVCYSTAAVAPVLVGALRDATGAYAAPFGLLAVLACGELAIATRLRPALRASVR
jgi:MFS transporter, CP family, cyanate transporter